jgi:predicted MFS family arabinose efflux permease
MQNAFGPRFVAPLLLGSTLNPVNSTMMATALVPIGNAYGVGPERTAWLIMSLYVASAVAQPVLGRLADRFGPRRVYLTGLVVVGLAGLAGALTTSLGQLVAVRTLLGFGTSAAYPAAVALVRARSRECDTPTQTRVLTALTVSMLVSAAVGPALGGLLVDWVGWKSIFLVNLPLAAVGLLMSWRWLPRDGRHVPAARAVARRDLRALFTDVPLLSTYLRCAVTYLVIYGVLYGFPQWLEDGYGLNAVSAGLLVLPMSAVAAVCSVLGARLSGVRRLLLVGSTAMFAGSLALCFLPGAAPLAVLVAIGATFGLPNGLNPIGNQAAMYAQAPVGQAGLAAGLLRTAQYAGAIVASGLILLGLSCAALSFALLVGTIIDRSTAAEPAERTAA